MYARKNVDQRDLTLEKPSNNSGRTYQHTLRLRSKAPTELPSFQVWMFGCLKLCSPLCSLVPANQIGEGCPPYLLFSLVKILWDVKTNSHLASCIYESQNASPANLQNSKTLDFPSSWAAPTCLLANGSIC